MSLAILFHFLCAQHVSDINIFIIRSLRLFCWITKLVVLFLVRCVLEFQCGWVGVVSVLQAEAQLCFSLQHGYHFRSSRLFCWITILVDCCCFDVCWSFGVVGLECLCFSLQHGYHSNPTTPKLQHTSNQEQCDQCGNSTNSRKLLMMNILMFETCWAHKKWNKIASDIKLVFYSSTITMMHGPINIRFIINLTWANLPNTYIHKWRIRNAKSQTASNLGGYMISTQTLKMLLK